MAYGQGRVSEGEVNQHKGMAGAMMKGSFGVGPLPQRRSAPHPDLSMPKGQTMDEGMRGAGPPMEMKGRRAQAAPDHGPMPKSHFVY